VRALALFPSKEIGAEPIFFIITKEQDDFWRKNGTASGGNDVAQEKYHFASAKNDVSLVF
jgi:hypothetical protein